MRSGDPAGELVPPAAETPNRAAMATRPYPGLLTIGWRDGLVWRRGAA